MTPITTAKAAEQANVTVSTVRGWCRVGAVSATKTAGKWAIDADSLAARIAIGQDIEAARIARNADQIITLADFTPFKGKADAHDGVMNLLQDGSVIHLTGSLYQVASKTSANVYLVDSADQTCDCKGWIRSDKKAKESEEDLIAYCAHLTAVNAIEASKGNQLPALAIAA